MVRVIYLVHESPGRLRLRLPYLREAAEEAEPLADHLSALEGMEEVRVRAYTGSVLCLFDGYTLTREEIVGAVREQTGIEVVLRPGESSLAEEQALAEAAIQNGSEVARSFATLFKGMNLEVLRASGGRVDLGTLAAATFATAGVAEVVTSGKLPLPPWFNLGWWAFRMFTTLEQKAIENAPAQNGVEHVPAPAQEGEYAT